jgi:polyhydroxyalkanoate synthesis repressor PhaR
LTGNAKKNNANTASSEDRQRVIKKYPNRRLYDTLTSSYVTLAEVKRLVIESTPLRVVDAKTQEDITRSILLQIILEEETCGVPMFSESALVNIIRFYGQLMQGFMGDYLEKNMQSFMDLQIEMAGKQNPPTPEIWQKLLTMKSPIMQSLVQSYAEKSKEAFQKMQDQMDQQTLQLLEAMRIRPPK